ncbi:MAG: uncharacterized protein A8A55_2671 [Amphiamblys sp. WSBS2006]|nr:MAG: uncharacterized protein A8A55_2671 [Amphiamblys sp. WSBS2006]
MQKEEVHESLEGMIVDVALLQETKDKGCVFPEGFVSISQPAEESPGKQGVCIAARKGLSSSGKSKARGKLTAGFVYIPIGREAGQLRRWEDASTGCPTQGGKQSSEETGT